MLSVRRKALKQIAGLPPRAAGVRSRLRDLVSGGIANVGLPAVVAEPQGVKG